MPSRLSKEEALSFLLTHIVVERQHTFEMNQVSLFAIMSLAAEAQEQIAREEGLIPHEVIEAIAVSFVENHIKD